MKTYPSALLLLILSAPALAADSSVKMPAQNAPENGPAQVEAVPTAQPGEISRAESGDGLQKKFEENHQITDAELRSRAGSVSRLSLKANFSYFGPTLENPSITDQPNPDGTVTASAVGPSGSLGARYRFDPSTAISLNAGITDQYLFTTRPAHLDVNNPFVTYDKSFKLGGVQMVASPGLTLVTSNVYRTKGEAAGLDARLYSAYNLGDSPFSIGASTTASYYFFDREYIPDQSPTKSDKGLRDGKIRRISITVAPVVKYNVTGKFNVNTSFGFNFFNPRYYDNRLKMNSRVVNEWVGLGYAVTRDIYLNPYIQFYPTQFTWKTATMNLSTVFSLL